MNRMSPTPLRVLQKLLRWLAVTLIVLLVILLPVVLVTGMFGGAPFGNIVALIGVMLLAYGVMWFVWGRSR